MSTISLRLYKAPRDWFQLIIYFNSYLIKPIHGEEIRSHCTDYLIDPLLNVKFLHLDQFKSPHSHSFLPTSYFSLRASQQSYFETVNQLRLFVCMEVTQGVCPGERVQIIKRQILLLNISKLMRNCNFGDKNPIALSPEQPVSYDTSVFQNTM